MADLLINGIELPKKGNIGLLLYSDGSVEICGTGSLSKPLYGVPVGKAVEIPEHGRLGDIDKAMLENEDILDCEIDHPKWQDSIREILNSIPIVLEASNG